MITPKKVFHYSAAATAGYAMTVPVVEWLMSIARWMSTIALLSFILALACLYTWITDRELWSLLCFVGLCAVALLMLVPMVIATRIALRFTQESTEEEKN